MVGRRTLMRPPVGQGADVPWGLFSFTSLGKILS